MTRTLLALVAALALGLGLVATAAAQDDDRDCEDFPNQAAAQAALDADPSDPANNDADNDGIACELFFDDAAGAGGGGTTTRGTAASTTRRMPSTGVGAVVGGAPDRYTMAPLALLALAAVSGVVALRERRQA